MDTGGSGKSIRGGVFRPPIHSLLGFSFFISLPAYHYKAEI